MYFGGSLWHIKTSNKDENIKLKYGKLNDFMSKNTIIVHA